MLIWFNGEFRSHREPLVQADSPAFRYGQGLFTTTAIYRYIPLWLPDHIRRLQQSLLFFGLETFDRTVVEAAARALPRKNRLEQGILRLLAWNEGNLCQVYISSGPCQELQRPRWELKSATSFRHSSQVILQHKTFNYWYNLLGYQEARQAGYDDCLFCNEKGEVSETSRGNLFWIEGKSWGTPDLSCGLLPGIAREKMITLARGLDLEQLPGSCSTRQISRADAVFVTNSVRGIIPVQRIDERRYDCRNALLLLLEQRYRELVRAYLRSAEGA